MLVEMRAEQESQLGVMIQEFRDMLRVANDDDDDDSGQRDVHDDADRQWAISEDEVMQSIEQEEALAEELVQQSQPTGGPDDDAALPALLPDQCSWCGFTDHTRKLRSKCPMHKDYSGSKPKGVPAFEGWCSMARAEYIKHTGQTRASVQRRTRKPTAEPLTPTSVLCAPTA